MSEPCGYCVVPTSDNPNDICAECWDEMEVCDGDHLGTCKACYRVSDYL